MQKKEELLRYLKQGIDELLEQGCFDGGQEFRPTQIQALYAYKNYLNSNQLTVPQKLKGFLEIPTGIGKTALFSGIISKAHQVANAHGAQLNSAIVVPTRPLLVQTRDSFSEFNPQHKGRIGLFGGGRKDLSQEFTIMTFESWYDLSQSAQIGSHNIDILLSDEAHKGTSERRVENLNSAFGPQTIQIAFTATARYDEAKSVHNSHERAIFEKSIREAMLEGAGELAAYVQGQRLVIRVEPTEFMSTSAFAKASVQDKILYRKMLRQDAWNLHALRVFKEGRDEYTGDLLSDNQAAFFVDGIDQADKLQNLLNEDTELQRRAKQEGYRGVAIAIHSKLSEREQETRLKAYKAGEFMAIIGDEIFKEGFDHKPLKTIIDYSHGSVVDKGQILGRGAREWWNIAKNRFEGLTFIDTVIYIGSHDKAYDKQLRNQALRRAVSVKDILGDSCVFGPGVPEKELVHVDHGPKRPFGDNPNVEYYADIADVFRVDNEISKLNFEDFEELTPELKSDLQSRIKRVGGTVEVAKTMESTERPMTVKEIYSIAFSKQKSARSEDVEQIINVTNDMPANIKRAVRKGEQKEILEHIERTQVYSRKLFSHMQNPPAGTYYGLIDEMVKSEGKKFPEAFILEVLETYRSLRFLTDVERDTFVNWGKKRGVKAEDICASLKRGGYDVTISEVRRLLKGATTIFKDHVIKNVLRECPDRLPIPPEVGDKIQAEKERTGVGTTALMSRIHPIPEGLNRNTLNRIVYYNQQSACPKHLEAILRAFASFPDKKPESESSVYQLAL